MKMRLTIIAFLAILLLMIAIVLIPRTRLSKTNFDRFPIGASLVEVRNILGDPNSEEPSPKKIIIFPPMPKLPEDATEIRWSSREGVAILRFQKERLIQKGWYPSEETFIESISGWFRFWVIVHHQDSRHGLG